MVEPAAFQNMGGWKGRADHENHMLQQFYKFRDFVTFALKFKGKELTHGKGAHLIRVFI